MVCTLILVNHSLVRHNAGSNDGKQKIRIALKVPLRYKKWMSTQFLDLVEVI